MHINGYEFLKSRDGSLFNADKGEMVRVKGDITGPSLSIIIEKAGSAEEGAPFLILE